MNSKSILNSILIICIQLFFAWNSPSEASNLILQVNVEVIKAERGSSFVDPELEDLVKEIGPVLNYTGFSLQKKIMIRLEMEKKEEVSLSSDRSLELQFLGYEEKKARLSVKISEKSRETFRTVILMVNKGNAMIGGPPHEGGVLLIRIGAEFGAGASK